VSSSRATGAGFLAQGTWPLRAVTHERVELPNALSSPRRARVLARELLGRRLDERRCNEMLVLVTELVTNAVRHAGLRPDQMVVVHLAAAAGVVRVEVCDGGVGFEPVERAPGPEGGFGLVLLRSLADRWGFAVEDGTCAWFEIDC
jgi:anti-sigma regulatory factor (Ser/Thr protein kinase)